MNGINTGYILGYANSIKGIINDILVPLLIAIAFLVFLWGIYYYFIKGAANEEDRAKGRVFTLYGIIGLVIIFSIWGIVQIFIGTLGLPAANAPAPPTIGGSGGSSTGGTSAFPSAGAARSTGTVGGGAGGSSGGGTSGGGTSGGVYPVSPNPNGSCNDGYHLASLGGYCIPDSNTGATTPLPSPGACTMADQDDCEYSGGTYDMATCACTPATGGYVPPNTSDDADYGY